MSNSLAEFGYDIGIEAQEGDHEGDLPSLVTIAWENTEDVKNLAGFFTLVKGVLAVSEAQCITHKVSTYRKIPTNAIFTNKVSNKVIFLLLTCE